METLENQDLQINDQEIGDAANTVGAKRSNIIPLIGAGFLLLILIVVAGVWKCQLGPFATPTPITTPEHVVITAILPTDAVLMKEKFPFIPSIEDIVTEVVTDYGAIEKVILSENEPTRMRLLIFLNATKGNTHSFDKITAGWTFAGMASSPCYTNTGYYKDKIGLMVADGNDRGSFPESESNAVGCSVEDEYYVEVIYDTEGFWIPKE